MQHIVAKKSHHDQTNKEAETAVEHIQRIGWMDGRTYRRTGWTDRSNTVTLILNLLRLTNRIK